MFKRCRPILKIQYLFSSAELVSELGDSDGELCRGGLEYGGLRINNQPMGAGSGTGVGGAGEVGGAGAGAVPIRTRVRHNSDGNYDDVSLMQETILREKDGEDEGQEKEEELKGEDRVYQNLEFHRKETKPEQRLANLISPERGPGPGAHYEHLSSLSSGRYTLSSQPGASPGSSLASLNSLGLPSGDSLPARPNCMMPLTSDCGSMDSHNDSGYSTRYKL